MNVTEATAAILAAGGKPAHLEAPNLIEDLTSEVPQRLAETPRADGRAR